MSVRIWGADTVNEVVFWGATGQAKVLNEALSGTDFRLVALVDNRDVISPFSGVPVLMGEVGLDAWLGQRGGARGLFAVIAVGGARGRDRVELMDSLQVRGLKPLTVIHRTAFVAADAQMGEGCQIMAQAAICTHVRLGNGVIVNTAASVDHDCVIRNGAHIAPGARLAGEVTVGERAFVGVGAIVLPRLHIGKDAIVGAGAVVTKNVQSGVTVMGNPARPKQINTSMNKT
jgi:sugar O-acyltransferase (sialic acid O-acetyltransferase NeuD family)